VIAVVLVDVVVAEVVMATVTVIRANLELIYVLASRQSRGGGTILFNETK
jgi:hypothetical protein